MPTNQIHSREIMFLVDDLDPTGPTGNMLYAELLQVTQRLVDIAREDAAEVGMRYGVEIQVREIND